MARHPARDDYEDDPDEPDESDMDADDAHDEVDTITCPHCRREVAEFAQQCSKCGGYLSDEQTPSRNQPKWVVVTAVVLLATMLLGALWWAF